MTPARTLLLGIVWVLASSPLVAQDFGDKVHLDDFAVESAGDEITEMTQVGDAPALDQSAVMRSDREVSVTALSSGNSKNADLQQLGEPKHAGVPEQIVRAGAERGKTVAPISSPKDSKPEPATRMTGPDACDPHSVSARRDPRCRRILELRSSEFHAPEAPKLSAEQELLAEQETRARKIATYPARSRELFANPDDISTQELAATAMERENARRTLLPSDTGDLGSGDISVPSSIGAMASSAAN